MMIWLSARSYTPANDVRKGDGPAVGVFGTGAQASQRAAMFTSEGEFVVLDTDSDFANETYATSHLYFSNWPLIRTI